MYDAYRTQSRMTYRRITQKANVTDIDIWAYPHSLLFIIPRAQHEEVK